MSFTVSILIRAIDKASGVIGSISSALSGLGGALTGLAGIMGEFASTVGEVFISALQQVSSVVQECVTAYADYEWVLVRAATATGALGEEADELVSSFEGLTRELSTELGISATQAARALESLVKAGLEGEEAAEALRATLMLAQIELMDTGEAADYVAAILRAFSLSADQASHVVDVLVNASIKGIATARDFAYALSFCSGIASKFGLTLEETVAALVAMNNQGIEASYAGRYLMRMLSDLIEHSDKLGFSIYDASGHLLSLSEIIARLEARLAEFSTDEERAAYLTSIFGTQGMRAALALLKASYAGKTAAEAIRALAEDLSKVGTASAIFEEQMETTSGSLARARASVINAMLALGEALAPAIEEVAKLVEDLAPIMAKLVTPAIVSLVKGLAQTLSLLAKPLLENQYLLEGFKILLQALANVALWLITGVLVPLANALYLLSAIAKAVSDAISWLSSAFVSAWQAMQDALGAFWASVGEPVFSALQSAISAIGEAIFWLSEAFQGACNAIWGAVGWLWGLIKPVVDAILWAINAIKSALESLVNWLKGACDAIGGFFTSLGEGISSFVRWLVGGSIWPEMLAKMSDVLDRYLGIMEERFREAMREMREEAEGLREELVGGSIWPSMLSAMYEEAREQLARIEDLFSTWELLGIGPLGTLAPAAARLGIGGPSQIVVHVHIGSLQAREGDVIALAHEIGRAVARELRIRGVLVA